MITTEYQVSGMTCGHCVASVTEEVSALPGVRDVAVDLASGDLRVQSEGPIPFAQIQRAVEDAGYTATER